MIKIIIKENNDKKKNEPNIQQRINNAKMSFLEMSMNEFEPGRIFAANNRITSANGYGTFEVEQQWRVTSNIEERTFQKYPMMPQQDVDFAFTAELENEPDLKKPLVVYFWPRPIDDQHLEYVWSGYVIESYWERRGKERPTQLIVFEKFI
jgi:hypothetical protein